MPIGRYRVYAHRGAMKTSPENTLEALSRARAEGVDGIEFDVRLSADGEPFLFHDDDARRVCGRDVPMSALRWSEVRELRVFGRHPIPHLDEVLEAMADWPGAELFLDLHQPSVPLAETAARRLTASGVRLAAMPGPPWLTAASCDLGAEAISLGWDGRLTRALYRALATVYDVRAQVEKAKRRGVAVSGGVANAPDEVRYFVAQGIDTIWTDDLAMARNALETLV